MSHHNLVDEKYEHMENKNVVISVYADKFNDFWKSIPEMLVEEVKKIVNFHPSLSMPVNTRSRFELARIGVAWIKIS